MSVFRINKNSNYTVMSNNHFKEKNMSLKAMGLLSLMLSLPQDWDYSIAGLAKICNDGKDSIRSALKELEDFGYLKRTQDFDEARKFKGYIYDIYEEPLEKNADFPLTENPMTENPMTENPTQLNTKELNNSIIKVSKKERKGKEEKTSETKTLTKKENKNNNHDRQSFDEIIERYMNHAENDLVLTNMLKEFLKIRYLKNKPLTNEVLSEEISRLFDYGKCNKYLMREIVNKTISNCWATFFPLSKEEEQKIIEELQECE